jgi:glycosyltransferase involved in cell wall biosynthesis
MSQSTKPKLDTPAKARALERRAVKVLLYSHFFAPSIGGVETIVMSLARGLTGFCALDGLPQFEVTLATQIPREDFDDSSLPFLVVRQPSFRKLLALIRESDVVHVAGAALPPVALGLLVHKPVVIEHHGFQVICPTGQLLLESVQQPCPGYFMAGRHAECWKCDPKLGWLASRKLWLLTFVRRFLSKRAAANIAPTAWLGRQLGISSVTIHHGLVPARSLARTGNTTEGVPSIVFQGRLVTTKGARLFLEAAKILCEQNEPFSIVFIGDGPERENLKRIAMEEPLAGKVEFAGRLVSSELEGRLSSARVVVVPSLGGEVFGLVVAENMQRGLPVVASDLGAFIEVLADAGEIFKTGDPKDLAAKIAALLHEPQRAGELAQMGKERAAKEFGLEKMIAEHASIYRNVNKPNTKTSSTEF